ncbi:MAG: tetratricopeptide repeat protein [Candidatus Brocadiia bacterium]
MKTAKSARRLIPAGRGALILAAWLLGAAAPHLTAQTSPAPSAPAPRPEAQQPSGPEPGQYWYEQAQVNQRYGMTDEAEKCYAKAIEAAKGTQLKVQVLTSWGDLLQRQKKPADAAEKFSQGLALAQDAPTQWRLGQSLAQALDNAGKTDEASAQYQTLFKTGRQPGQREWARDRLIDLYRRLQKTEDLIRVFEDLAASDPQDPLPLQTLVWIYRDVKQDLPAARAAAVKLLALKSDDAQVILQLADIEVRLKNTEQAIALYEKLGGSQPAQRATCYERISNAYFSSDQKDKGFEWAEKAAKVEPQNAMCWMRFGDACCNYGEAPKSLPAYAKADTLAQSEGDHDTIKLHLANAYRSLKRDGEAIAFYKELAAKPKSPVHEQAKRELFELYSQRGLLDKVKIDLDETPAAPPPAK